MKMKTQKDNNFIILINIFLKYMIRLHKYLSQKWILSLRLSEKYISNGKIFINWNVAKKWQFIDPDFDKIEIDKSIIDIDYVYFIYNKPKWIVTVNANKTKWEIEIKDVLELPNWVVPIWRLDKQTTGLVLLTNDTVLQSKLLSPDSNIPKKYIVLLYKNITDTQIISIEKWIMIDWYITKKSFIKKISKNIIEITIFEGKNRQIRKMFRAIWNSVLELNRISFWKLNLWNLKIWKLLKIKKEDIF